MWTRLQVADICKSSSWTTMWPCVWQIGVLAAAIVTLILGLGLGLGLGLQKDKDEGNARNIQAYSVALLHSRNQTCSYMPSHFMKPNTNDWSVCGGSRAFEFCLATTYLCKLFIYYLSAHFKPDTGDSNESDEFCLAQANGVVNLLQIKSFQTRWLIDIKTPTHDQGITVFRDKPGLLRNISCLTKSKV